MIGKARKHGEIDPSEANAIRFIPIQHKTHNLAGEHGQRLF